ncbi:MAG: hypothetical protein WC539_01335 [Nitrospirota bacterium]
MRYLIKICIVAALCMIPALSFSQTTTYNKFVKSGFEQLKTGDYRAAKEAFEQAVWHDDTRGEGHLGLGIAYFHLRDDTHAERSLIRASEIMPQASQPFEFLGELYYRKDDLETAASYWQKALALNPGSAVIQARLDRITREHKTEKDFNRDVTSHFLIKYEGRQMIEAGRIILRILEDAYGTIGRTLSCYPSEEIQAILYSSKQFQEVTDAPGWSGGLYDGKIRIPIGGITQETPGLRRLLYHEYTHALIRTIAKQVPTWLNEGLAQCLEGRELSSYQKTLLKQLALQGKIPSLSNLEGSFTGLHAGTAGMVYLISFSSVRYMIDTYGMYRVRSILDELGKGSDIRSAISSSIMISYEEFERGWRRSLE